MVTRLGPGPEFDLIRRFLGATSAPAEGHPGVRLGPGDDCAVVMGDGIAVTVDMAVEDVHFRRDWLEPEEIGWRAAAAGLSDLAAMAARPIGILASIALPDADAGGPGVALMRGVARAAADAGAALIGGDLVRSSGPLVVDIVALGEAPDPVRRSGARPGEELWVTGTLGAAAAAVAAWGRGEEPDPAAREAFARPRPRIAEALWLAERRVPSAMLDLSDGIAGDAGHLAAASGVRVVVEAAALPVAPSAAGAPEPVRLAAAGGEDYELCFAALAGVGDAVRAAFEARFGIPLTRVGRIEVGEGVVVVDERGDSLDVQAFQHWREGA
ncbi:MAG TPA: thiamine-phosphate kinase [Longimicrobiales bacterium]|nr:thiamine-phosphate kinase [Longimicrobiales bacterium]